MKQIYWTTIIVSALFLTGCGGPAPVAVPSTTANRATAPAPSNSSNPGSVSASVIVIPAGQSKLGFIISAPIKEIDVKEGDIVKAGQVLMVLDTPELANSVTGAEATVSSQQAIVELMNYSYKKTFQGGRFVYVKAYIERRQQAQAQLDAAQAALDRAKYTLAQGTLVAPYDGTIVAINVKTGELVQPGEVVAVLGTLDHLQVQTTDLSERNIARVQIGQIASVRLKAFAQDLSGRVIAISPMGEKSKGDVIYKVTIELDSPPLNLLWGMSGDVTIQAQ